jgi:hypothetical protein
MTTGAGKGAGRLPNGIRHGEEMECVRGNGLVGRRYFGSRHDFRGQVIFFEEEVVGGNPRALQIAETARFGLQKEPCCFRCEIGGVAGEAVRVSRGASSKIVRNGGPCHWMDRVVGEGTERFMKESFRGCCRSS